MIEVFESATVTVRKHRYDDLLRKEAAYDAYARKLKADKDRGGYVCEYEYALFVEDEPKLPDPTGRDWTNKMPTTEEPAEISGEIWDEIEAMVDEREEENGTETV